MMSSSTFARLMLSAAIMTSIAACGGNKPSTATSTTVETTAPAVTVEATAPAAAPTADASAAGVTYASLTGDAAAGEKVFAQCKTCHVAEKGVNRVGPSLWDIIGRHSGSIAGFRYSAANKNSGIVWSEEELFKYLEAPQKTIPGTYMAFAGLKKPQDRADVIAYLKTKA